jgi:alanine or glycine:cation symporter, AGCS family
LAVSDLLNSKFGPIVEVLDKIIFWDLAKFLGFEDSQKIPFVVVRLIIGGVFFTISLKFISLRGGMHAWEIALGRSSNKADAGKGSYFQALATALSATVGLGNIAGVAIAELKNYKWPVVERKLK